MARRFPRVGWLGLVLIAVFWTLNWTLPGLRTQWGFFPLWLGYCLLVDALVFWRKGSSLLTRSWRRYLGLFLVSAPLWWLFELFNLRLQNWIYAGADHFTPLTFFLFSTLSFTTVVPAVFGTAELLGSFAFIQRLKPGLRLAPDRRTTWTFFILGWLCLLLMLAWPRWFFPFLWLSLYFILEPLNVWLGGRHLAAWTGRGDWRPVVALWLGVLICGFFWECWNFYSYPKWIYDVPWGNAFKIFEMPLLGYGGYLPFALELHAAYHLILKLFGIDHAEYIQITP